MADEKSAVNESTCGVRGEEGKFYCTECGAELKIDHDCPECKRQIDWDRALVELRRGSVGF